MAAFLAIMTSACAPTPVSLGLLGVNTVAGVAGAVDAARSPSEKIRDRVGRDCVGFVLTTGGPACTAKLASAGPFGVSGSAPPPPQGASKVANDPQYEDCMFRTIVRGQPGSC